MILAPQDCMCPIVEEGPSLLDSPVCSGNFLFMVLLQAYLWGRCDISTPCKRIESVNETDTEYDFIVVGAGTAGSIVSGRLSENSTDKVLLIEAGGPEPLGARIPSLYRNFWGNEQVDWRVRTVPDNYCLDQEGLGCYWPVGKGIGGTSLLNGMMYSRGHRADFDDWVEAGAEGWSWDDLQPYMNMAEGNKQVGTLVNGTYHSDTGVMPIQTFNYQPPQLDVLLKAIKEAGLPIITDMNNPNTPVGFSVAQTFNCDGQRYTTARAYLSPRSNLDVKQHAHVTKVLIEGRKAVGVEYLDKDGNTVTIKARKEVILSAGALGSPKILMLSGVGPKKTLDELGISVVADLPVGQTLKNHCGASVYFKLDNVNNTETLDWNALTEYLLNRGGPMSSTGLTQLTGLLYSSFADQTKKQPDLQFFFNGFYAECSKTGVIGEPVGDCLKSGYNISANVVALLPRSVGYMTLNSTNPLDQAIFNPNYFSHPDDMAMIKEGFKYLQKIFNSEILQEKYKIVLDTEYTQPCDDIAEPWSDEWIECMARLHTDPQNHQLGTSAIGTVVDPDLKVYNIENLRVIDAGSMPSQPTGNPQGSIMAVAEKGAHLIREAWGF